MDEDQEDSVEEDQEDSVEEEDREEMLRRREDESDPEEIRIPDVQLLPTRPTRSAKKPDFYGDVVSHSIISENMEWFRSQCERALDLAGKMMSDTEAANRLRGMDFLDNWMKIIVPKFLDHM